MNQNIPDSIENFNLFPWNENFATGIDVIDQQHQQLVAILNRLARHTVSGLLNKQQLWELLEELVDYTQYHFKTEEDIWYQQFSGHPLLSSHELAHKTFFEKIQTIRDSGADIDDFINDLFGFLTRWLAFHILDSDRRMAIATLEVQNGLALDDALGKAQQQMTGSMAVLIRAILDMYGELSTRAIEMMQQRFRRIQAEEALHEAQELLMQRQVLSSEERYQVLFDVIPDSVFVVRCEDLRITALNSVAQQLSGRRHEELIGTMIQNLHPDKESHFILERFNCLAVAGDAQVRFETRMRGAEGQEIDVEISVRGPFELRQEQSLVAIYRDISAIKHHQSQLEYVAYYDLQTGLLSRNGLQEILEACFRRNSEQDVPLLLLHLDIDNFSRVNDTYGAAFGDLTLMAFTQRIAEVLPKSAHIGRIGGDEFLIMILGLSDTTTAVRFVETLIEDLEKPLTVSNLALNLTISVGANLVADLVGLTSEALMRQTAHASYLAKLRGVSQYQFFDRLEELVVRDRHALIEEIYAGIPRSEFELYYQPKIDMRSGRVLGAEALIRWHHPVRGFLSPGEFIPVTQDHEIALNLGVWVLQSALRQLDCWSADHPELSISINISSVEIQSARYAQRLVTEIQAWPSVDPSRLQLELLESSALSSLATVIRNLQDCRTAGVSIAIDDFGTGYSSLSYLKRLPLDWLKLDQSFVREMDASGDDRAIILGVLAISQAYGLKVIAEGVETMAQRNQLVELGCHYGQGYGIGMPMPIHEFNCWLSAWRESNPLS